MHGFTVYDDVRVMVELGHSEIFVAEPADVELYRNRFERLLAIALAETETVAALNEVVQVLAAAC